MLRRGAFTASLARSRDAVANGRDANHTPAPPPYEAGADLDQVVAESASRANCAQLVLVAMIVT